MKLKKTDLIILLLGCIDEPMPSIEHLEVEYMIVERIARKVGLVVEGEEANLQG